MKLIQLTDDHYVLDAGPDISPSVLEELRSVWTQWWTEHGEIPKVFVVAGRSHPVVYEDRRDPQQQLTASLEQRIARLEQHYHYSGLMSDTGAPRYPEPEV